MEEYQKAMGSIAVSKDGKIIYSRSLGSKDLKSPNNENTLFRIGSISKTFTATLVMKAVEDKLLGLDQKLSSFFPEIPKADQITLSHLLSHRSGIHNFTSLPSFMQWYTRPHSQEELLKTIVNGGSVFEPGSKEDYSNSNYVLLSFILEKIHKTPYNQILDKQIIQPLKLKYTRYGSKIQVDQNEALSYIYMGNWILHPETDLSIPLGAGGIVSTPSDILTFAEALFSGKLLHENSVEEMKSGYGLFPMPYMDHKGYGHTGGIDGFKSVFTYFPNEKIGIAITSNGFKISPSILTQAVRNAALGAEVKWQDFAPVQVSEEDLQSYVGTYSGPDLPLKITISRSGQKLYAQATGQLPILLEAVTKETFQFLAADIEINFLPYHMSFKQGGRTFTLSKE
jgi:D-alanyl-D-alanine carboxypeptidase